MKVIKKEDIRDPKNIVAIVKMSNLEDRLEMDDSIDHCLTDCMSKLATVKELK